MFKLLTLIWFSFTSLSEAGDPLCRLCRSCGGSWANDGGSAIFYGDGDWGNYNLYEAECAGLPLKGSVTDRNDAPHLCCISEEPVCRMCSSCGGNYLYGMGQKQNIPDYGRWSFYGANCEGSQSISISEWKMCCKKPTQCEFCANCDENTMYAQGRRLNSNDYGNWTINDGTCSAGSYPDTSTKDEWNLCCSRWCDTPSIPPNANIVSGCTGRDQLGDTCTLGCNGGYYGTGTNKQSCSGSGTYSFNWQCHACSVCGTNQYQYARCGATTNTDCRSCKVCASGMFRSSGCTGSTDSTCSYCRNCTEGSYTSSNCSSTSNTVCAAITCNSGYLPSGSEIKQGCRDDHYNETCTLACKAGYEQINGSTTQICKKNGIYPASDLSCADVDECQTPQNTCIKPAECSNKPGSFECICPSGLIVNQSICMDIDECLNVNNTCRMANLTCKNTFGSYSCLPLIINSTLVDNSQPNSMSGLILSDTKGGQILSFQLKGNNLDLHQISFEGLPNSSATNPLCPLDSDLLLPRNCTTFTYYLNSTFVYQVSCAIPAGVGACLHFIVSYCTHQNYDTNRSDNIPYCSSVSGTDVFGYPPPIIDSRSLRLALRASNLGGNQLTLQSDTENSVSFNGGNFWNSPTHVFVFYGPSQNLYKYSCRMDPILTTFTTMTCLTAINSTENYHLMTISIPSARVNVTGTDELSFPLVPSLVRFEGCPSQGCPTSGNVNITIIGWNFAVPISALVGSECPIVEVNITGSSLLSSVVCTLPEGTGLQPVIVTSIGLFSEKNLTVPYARPLIANISSRDCESTPTGNLVNCSRTGGNITIHGDQFGAAGARVLIGGNLCQNLTYLTPHLLLLCIFPAGIRLNQQILVIQDNAFSESSLTLSYQQCTPGTLQPPSTSQNLLVCELCQEGFYSDQEGAETCKECKPGSYSNRSGSSGCESCSPGTWSSDTAFTGCVECKPGTYREEGNMKGCTECEPGKYSNGLASTTCLACQPGRVTSSSNQPACRDCDVGSFTNNESGNSQCSVCPMKQYNTKPGATTCYICQRGMNCLNGQASAATNYWTYLPAQGEPLQVYSCPNNNICLNGTCAANRVNSSDNPLCGKCLDGYSEWGNSCIECKEINSILISGFLILLWVYILILHWISQMPGTSYTKVISYFLATAHYLVPPSYYWLAWLWFLDFSPNKSSGSTCLGPITPYQKLVFDGLTPLILFGQLFVTCILHYLLLLVLRKRTTGFSFFLDPYIRTFLAILLYSYTTISTFAFNYLNCVEAGPYHVVFANPAVSCDSEQYLKYRGIIIALIIFPVCGLPLLLFFLLYRYRQSILFYETATHTVHKNASDKDKQIIRRYGILFDTYRVTHYTYELWAVCRRVILLLFGILLSQYVQIRAYLLILWNFVVFYLHHHFQPFHEHDANIMETMSLSCLLIISVLVYATDSETVIGIPLQVVVTLFVLIPAIGFLIYFIYVTLKSFRIWEKKKKELAVEGEKEASTGKESIELENLNEDVETSHVGSDKQRLTSDSLVDCPRPSVINSPLPRPSIVETLDEENQSPPTRMHSDRQSDDTRTKLALDVPLPPPRLPKGNNREASEKPTVSQEEMERSSRDCCL